MEIYIVRHGETMWNREKRLQGHKDIMLNESGIEAAKRTGDALKDVHFDKIYSSPLTRAYDTAMYIKGDRDISIIKDDRIKEIKLGDLEGKRGEDLINDEESTFRYFFTQPQLFVPDENGESFEELIARAKDFMQNEIEPNADKLERVMIVAHGAMNKAIVSYIKNNTIDKFWDGAVQKNCNIIIANYKKCKYEVTEEERVYNEGKN